MRSRAGIGRTEVIVAVVVVLVLAAIATPFLLGSSKKYLRAEVPTMVEQIKAAEIASMGAFDTYEAAEAAPRGPTQVNAEPVPWTPTRGFDRLAWAPDDETAVYGSYRVVLTDDGFKVIGTIDADGDGKRAVFEATQDTPPTMVSPEDYY